VQREVADLAARFDTASGALRRAAQALDAGAAKAGR
jgi:hypothetical protein